MEMWKTAAHADGKMRGNRGVANIFQIISYANFVDIDFSRSYSYNYYEEGKLFECV